MEAFRGGKRRRRGRVAPTPVESLSRVIFAITVLSWSMTNDGMSGKPRSLPNAWPSVMAYVRKSLRAAAVSPEFCGTIAYV